MWNGNFQFVCQIVMVLMQVLTFFVLVNQDFNGRTAKPPGGMTGFIGTLIGITVTTVALYGAGAFSILF